RLILLIALFLLVTLGLLVSRILAFVQLFFEHSGVAITQQEIASAYAEPGGQQRPQLIPKIIHQVYHDWRHQNQLLPSDWDDLRQTCISLNEDWEYMLWTEEKSRDFLEANYPHFIKTYDGYRYPVQRVDALRYFLMHHYGGIYLDLDNGCLESLTPFLYYPAWTVDGGHGALSNNILGSKPSHPFWKLLTDSLLTYDYNYFFPYVTISYASGQWFETAIWQEYHSSTTPENHLYRIMLDNRPGTDPWIFFTQARGETWKNWDNVMFLWIGDHLIVL
ncbi:hypothetical protein OIDMADRAFT_71161, partial [Oidiodendron maius Zn]